MKRAAATLRFGSPYRHLNFYELRDTCGWVVVVDEGVAGQPERLQVAGVPAEDHAMRVADGVGLGAAAHVAVVVARGVDAPGHEVRSLCLERFDGEQLVAGRAGRRERCLRRGRGCGYPQRGRGDVPLPALGHDRAQLRAGADSELPVDA